MTRRPKAFAVMAADRCAIAEHVQRKVAHLVATQPAGVGLCLVGGFRYRLLDRGVRRSIDIDYHWDGDLESKQRELVDLFERRLLPDVRRQMRLDGSVGVGVARGAAAESAAVAGRSMLASVRGLLAGLLDAPGRRP